MAGRRALIAVILCLVPAAAAPAQVRDPREPLKLAVDYSRFRGDSTSLYIEFYYSFSPQSLTYRTENGTLRGGLDLTVLIFLGDSLKFADRRLVSHELKDTSGLTSTNLVSLSAAQLPGGDYLTRVIGRDINDSTRVDSLEFRIPVVPVDPVRVVLSDIELATSIVQGDPESQFYKNTLEIVPNPQALFGENQLCYYYVEIYNLLTEEDSSDYFVRSVVLDASRRVVESRSRARKRAAESGVIVDRVMVGKLHTGTYTLGITVADTAGTVLSRSLKKFFVYNSVLGTDSTIASLKPLSLTNVYSAMSEGDLDKEFDETRYLRGGDEEAQYDRLSGVEAKAAFLVEFWNERPPGMREEYMGRVAFVNEQFRVLGRDGYKTDRGRVYIVYGPASDYDRHPNEPEYRPYEVWTYENIQGGVIFAFVQRVANGEYELVHSTHRNEIQDELWLEHYARTAR